MIADWNTECIVCGQVPSIQDMDMCAACTFGSASAQQELINGEMSFETNTAKANESEE